MWMKRRSSMSAVRPGSPSGCCTWILLAIIHLTMDFTTCTPLTQGPSVKFASKSIPRHRAGGVLLWEAPIRPSWRAQGPGWKRVLYPLPQSGGKSGKGPVLVAQKQRGTRRGPRCEDCQAKYSSGETLDSSASPEGRHSDSEAAVLVRSRRQTKWDSYERSRDSRTTTVPGFIDWGPTGGDEGAEEDGRATPGSTAPNKVLTSTTNPTTTIATTTKRSRNSERKYAATTARPRKHSTTAASGNVGETAKPSKPVGDTAGLAVHQIITITVSLIMVIAAFITTLVLKNCCAQSGNGRHNSHQRKINQQEESCQNLTDFTPARVSSSVDIFTAYNDSLQCSHECVRTPVPVYTDEMIQQTPVYKTSYNGNRPPPSERQLIPVAFVSEKWFEISC